MSRHQETVIEFPVELENQFILRLPPEPAKALREAIRSGSMNLKDRLSIRFEPDMRYGEVRLDHWLLHAKLMDLPAIIESLKTIDNKSFYKTADICQLLICSEEKDPVVPEEEQPKKKKDPNKVDKKYLWPHGVTPPLKSVRRRRFRKTLKKKYVEAPEIEKEVKRLLRVDNEAVAVKYEILTEEQLGGNIGAGEGTSGVGAEEDGDIALSRDVAEHEIFGEAVSDSEAELDSNSEDDEEEDGQRRIVVDDEEESSRLMMSGGEESRLSADNSGPSVMRRAGPSNLVTQFSREMFVSAKNEDSLSTSPVEQSNRFSSFHSTSLDKNDKLSRLTELKKELESLRAKREQQEISGDENLALRQRFCDMLNNVIAGKEQEYSQLCNEFFG